MFEHQSGKNADATAVKERRAWVRRSCNLETSGRATAAMREVHWFGTLLELSPGGLRLLLNRRFETGSVLEIEVNSEHGLHTPTLIARVVHVTAEDDGLWALGCALDQVLTADELAGFLGEDSETK